MVPRPASRFDEGRRSTLLFGRGQAITKRLLRWFWAYSLANCQLLIGDPFLCLSCCNTNVIHSFSSCPSLMTNSPCYLYVECWIFIGIDIIIIHRIAHLPLNFLFYEDDPPVCLAGDNQRSRLTFARPNTPNSRKVSFTR